MRVPAEGRNGDPDIEPDDTSADGSQAAGEMSTVEKRLMDGNEAFHSDGEERDHGDTHRAVRQVVAQHTAHQLMLEAQVRIVDESKDGCGHHAHKEVRNCQTTKEDIGWALQPLKLVDSTQH